METIDGKEALNAIILFNTFLVILIRERFKRLGNQNRFSGFLYWRDRMPDLNLLDPDDKQRFYNSMNWRKMRDKIRKKFNYECQTCKASGKLTIDTGEKNRNGRKKSALIVHHIKELEQHPDLGLEEENLTLVCF